MFKGLENNILNIQPSSLQVEGILNGTNDGKLKYLQQYLDEVSPTEEDGTGDRQTTSGIVS